LEIQKFWRSKTGLVVRLDGGSRLRPEGRDEVIRGGDVMHFRFNV
jgi:ribosome-binding ATPase YchF (GTP1/OBG family)